MWVSGVRCQVSGNESEKAETCWSEAEIPSEAKRKRETLNTETLVVGIWDCRLQIWDLGSTYNL